MIMPFSIFVISVLVVFVVRFFVFDLYPVRLTIGNSELLNQRTRRWNLWWYYHAVNSERDHYLVRWHLVRLLSKPSRTLLMRHCSINLVFIIPSVSFPFVSLAPCLYSSYFARKKKEQIHIIKCCDFSSLLLQFPSYHNIYPFLLKLTLAGSLGFDTACTLPQLEYYRIIYFSPS